MASVDDNIEITRQREHVDQRIAFLVVGISFVFFRILNFLIAKLVDPLPALPETQGDGETCLCHGLMQFYPVV